MEFTRLALLRLVPYWRVYTQSHLVVVAGTLARIAARREEMRGYTTTYAPRPLRHFTAWLEP